MKRQPRGRVRVDADSAQHDGAFQCALARWRNGWCGGAGLVQNLKHEGSWRDRLPN
jgi:hypothetical protein